MPHLRSNPNLPMLLLIPFPSSKEHQDMKQFSCGAVVPGCTATFEAEDENGILGQVAEHAKNDHGMDEVPAEVVDQVKANITEAA